MITDEVYVEIELLRRHGLSLRRIAAEVGCAVNTVRAHLVSPGLPRYARKVKRVTKLAPFEAYSRHHPQFFKAALIATLLRAAGLAYVYLGEQLGGLPSGCRTTAIRAERRGQISRRCRYRPVQCAGRAPARIRCR